MEIFPTRPFFDIKNYLGYNLSMKKIIITSFLFFLCSSVFAGSTELSRQAIAFYSDNNPTKTMDLILQINEKERSQKHYGKAAVCRSKERRHPSADAVMWEFMPLRRRSKQA